MADSIYAKKLINLYKTKATVHDFEFNLILNWIFGSRFKSVIPKTSIDFHKIDLFLTVILPIKSAI